MHVIVFNKQTTHFVLLRFFCRVQSIEVPSERAVCYTLPSMPISTSPLSTLRSSLTSKGKLVIGGEFAN